MHRTNVFPASVHPGAEWKSWLLTGFLAVIAAGLATFTGLGNLPLGPKIAMIALILFSVFLTVFLGLGMAMSVNRVRYELKPDGLQIMLGRWRGPFIPRRQLRGVVKPKDVRPHLWSSMAGIRMAGLYVATVNNPEYGKVALFVTTRDHHLVLLDAGGIVYGLSPAQPDEFIAALTRWGVPQAENLAQETRSAALAGDQMGLQTTDRLLFILSAVLLVVAAVWVGLRLPALPEQVPVHFNVRGEPDRYGSPMELVGIAWFLLGTNLFAGVGMIWLFARNNIPFITRMLSVMSLATAVLISIVAVSMTY